MKARREESGGWRVWAVSQSVGVLTALTVGAVCLLLIALLMTFFDLPPEMETTLSVIAAVLGAFVGGLVAGRMSGKQGWLVGAVCGLAVWLILLVTGIVLHRGADIGFLFIKLAALLSGGMIGGMVGVNRK